MTNFERYSQLHNEVMKRLEEGEITTEQAKEVNDKIFDKYITEGVIRDSVSNLLQKVRTFGKELKESSSIIKNQYKFAKLLDKRQKLEDELVKYAKKTSGNDESFIEYMEKSFDTLYRSYKSIAQETNTKKVGSAYLDKIGTRAK